ncbi:MAG: HAMP domain-containing sensor histidine kinase [Sediminicola sp.]|tara:strand:- start:198 stop:1286 length:1089 start_codon:yes stop_codon:yes gene_type:complete
MTQVEEKLQERIKELTCLYEVTSIIANCDYDQLETSLEAIILCLKRAWRYNNDTFVHLRSGTYDLSTHSRASQFVFLTAPIKVFNQKEGAIKVGYPSERYAESDFLEEEQLLLNNVCAAVGNLMERKQIRENELALKKKMEQSDRLAILGEITAGIAHELNTPLANILGFAELMKARVKDPKLARDLEKIVDSALFSREVVKKLMFFACGMPQHMGQVDVNQILKNVLNLLEPTFKKNKVEHTLLVNRESISMKADNIQLTQVLFNIIMNAVYYTPEGGKIAIEVIDTDQNVRIKVADEGPGIAKKHREKIFEPFFTTKPVGQGNGLGLSVVHGIINSHKGKIVFTANSPKGAICTMDFPKL